MEAPMSSSLGAMGSLLRKLHSLLDFLDHLLPKPLKEKIELLKQDLEGTYTFLKDLSRVETPNTMVKIWVNEVRDLSYDIEDYFDNLTPSAFNSISDEEIDEFVTLVREARERHKRYVLRHLEQNPSYVTDVQDWVPIPYGEAAHLVGNGNSRCELIELVNNNSEGQLKVLAIHGPGGVGKTTLAEEVYREIGGQFECRAFVRASRTPDTRRLLRSIIAQAQCNQQIPYGYNVQELIDILSRYLQNKRYFIVIDGLWETTSWDIFNSAFPQGSHRSRILITTDMKEVAMECCYYECDCIFEMKPLNRNDSAELFFNRVFGSKHRCPEELKEVSEEIATKCGGLPLATVSMACVLSSQPIKLELWYRVQEFLSSSVNKSVTSEHMLREILCLSYNNLSHHLKTCLLYLSMYPEGYTFLKADVVKQWTAEGFAIVTAGKDTIEAAECYFDELLYRGLIQPNHINLSDEEMLYTVHSSVFEIIRYKSIEDNFITVIDYSETITEHYAKVRRLSLSFSNAKYATKPEGITLSSVRSLTFYGLVECLPLIMEFKVLRVLILEFWGDQEELDLSGISRLVQLRYMRITTGIVVKLPANIQGLLYLETLEVYARVTAVPTDIVQLPNLLHLCLHGQINMPDGIGHMRSLRTLRSFNLSSNSENNVRNLGNMTNLQDLHLICSATPSDHLMSNLMALTSTIGKLGNLKSFILSPDSSCKSIYSDCWSCMSSAPIGLQRLELLPPICIFSRLPVWIGQLRKLRVLKISIEKLTNYDVNGMAGLQELIVLALYVRQQIAETIFFNQGAFPVLKYFIYRCGVLHLAFKAAAMPNLRRLKLEFNAHRGKKHGDLLAGIEHLLNLQYVTVQIGAAPSAGESDRMATESELKDAIRKHSRLLSFNVRRVHWVDEEVSQLSNKTKSTSPSSNSIQFPCNQTDKQMVNRPTTGDEKASNDDDSTSPDKDTEVSSQVQVKFLTKSCPTTTLTRTPKIQVEPSGTANAKPKLQQLVKSALAPSSRRPASVLPHKTANVRDHYRIGKKLGQGQFGTTYQCVGKADGAEYACKSIPKRKLLCREDYEDVWREIQIMHHLSEHPNVVRIRGAYEDALFVHLVMELCAGGELFDRIVAKGHYSERAAAQLIRTIVGVVEGCHSLGVMHRDLKPENFLFASTAEDAPLKATDFGLSVFYKPGDKFSDVVGSPYYVAPEVLQKCYGPEADVWSAGVILYILLCGVPPFWAESEAGIFRQILRGKLDLESDPWPSISDSAKDLVRKMLIRDPTKRMTAHEVLCHPWIVDDAVAPDKPIDSAVLSRLKNFSAMNKLKKMALRVIAESLSEEEIGGLKELFKMIDTDNSGTITYDELKNGLKRVGSDLMEPEIQALMDAADIDNSGTIDYGEFLAATLHMNKLEREESLVSAFAFFDKDGSGFITIDELSQACQQFGLSDVHLEDMIKDVDQNNDGQIDYSEFAAMMRKGNAGGAGRRTMRNSLHVDLGELLKPTDK